MIYDDAIRGTRLALPNASAFMTRTRRFNCRNFPKRGLIIEKWKFKTSRALSGVAKIVHLLLCIISRLSKQGA